jgi:hypothetical protein
MHGKRACSGTCTTGLYSTSSPFILSFRPVSLLDLFFSQQSLKLVLLCCPGIVIQIKRKEKVGGKEAKEGTRPMEERGGGNGMASRAERVFFHGKRINGSRLGNRASMQGIAPPLP